MKITISKLKKIIREEEKKKIEINDTVVNFMGINPSHPISIIKSNVHDVYEESTKKVFENPNKNSCFRCSDEQFQWFPKVSKRGSSASTLASHGSRRRRD